MQHLRSAVHSRYPGAAERDHAALRTTERQPDLLVFRMSSYTLKNLGDYLAGKSPPYLPDDLTSADWVIFSLVNSQRQPGAADQQFPFRAAGPAAGQARDPVCIWGAVLSGCHGHLTPDGVLRPVQQAAPVCRGRGASALSGTNSDGRVAGEHSRAGIRSDLHHGAGSKPDHFAQPGCIHGSPQKPTSDPAATPVPLFKIGDTIAIQAGPIKDHNGNSVPDGTVVHFSMSVTGEGGGILQQADANTTQGKARVSFGLDKPGLLQIRATSDPALISEVLQLDVSSGGQPAAVTVIVPQLTPEAPATAVRTPQPVGNEFITGRRTTALLGVAGDGNPDPRGRDRGALRRPAYAEPALGNTMGLMWDRRWPAGLQLLCSRNARQREICGRQWDGRHPHPDDTGSAGRLGSGLGVVATRA